jgi:hypothetical protein
VRLTWGMKSLPWLLPDEEVLFSVRNLRWCEYRFLPWSWSFGAGTSLPPLVTISFYITNNRAVTVWRHCGLLGIDLSLWRPNTSKPEANEFIRSAGVGHKRFGRVDPLTIGSDLVLWGAKRTHRGKLGEVLPYLEIASGWSDKRRVRKLRIFMGTGPEAIEQIASAHRILLEGL